MRQINLRRYFTVEGSFSLTGVIALELVPDSASYWLLAESTVEGTVSRIHLSENSAISISSISSDLGASLTTRLTEGLYAELGSQGYLLNVESMTGNVIVQQLDAAGNSTSQSMLQTDTGVSVHATHIEVLTVTGQTYLAATGALGNDISLYRVEPDFQLHQMATAIDTIKSNATGVSGLRMVQVGGETFVISISGTEDGLSSYRIDNGGDLVLQDSIGTKDGLWISGLSELASIETGGETYLIATASQSNSMAVVRLNSYGVFFITDIVNDTRDTRFAGASALDTFEVNGRDFIVVGGNDGGFSLFELLPEGQLFHQQTIVQTTEWNIGAIEELRAVVLGNEVQIIVSGTGQGGLAQFVLPLNGLGDQQIGTAAANHITGGVNDDMLFGLAGNDRLVGGAGDDTLFAGSGSDMLTGGVGADVFVFTADGQSDRITDFEFGIDQLHLGGWGRLYDISALDISRTSTGAVIRWRGEEIVVTSSDHAPINIADWSMADFIF